MSSYIVKNETINRIVAYVAFELEWTKHSLIKTLAQEHSIIVTGETWEDGLASAMAHLNALAYSVRYGEDTTTFKTGFVYQPVLNDASDVQAFKTLLCWLYQCREGDIPRTPLFRFFTEVAHELAVKIVRESPGYDKAQWG